MIHLHEVSKTELIKVEYRIVVSRGSGRKGNELLFNGYNVSVT